jgi:hypothetical protein
MHPRLRMIGRLGVVALFAVLVCFLYLKVRGGFYLATLLPVFPIYPHPVPAAIRQAISWCVLNPEVCGEPT